MSLACVRQVWAFACRCSTSSSSSPPLLLFSSEERIAKHQVVCRKNAAKKPRKQFPSAEEMRLRGTDFMEYKDCRTEMEWKSR